jgi:hypothetical protein
MMAIDSTSIPHYHKDTHDTPAKIRVHSSRNFPKLFQENVFFFREACEEFGVPKQNLFFEADLLEAKNMVKVLDCLDSLAECAVKKGFPIPVERIPDEDVDASPGITIFSKI